MQQPNSVSKISLKTQMVELLDKYLLGYISPKELINAAVPMLMISTHKRGRKNYIEKLLMDISSRPENQISREYIYQIRETIIGEGVIPEKDRKKVLKRTLKKLIERLIFEEIEVGYFISSAYDVMCDFHEEIELEPIVKSFLESIRTFSDDLPKMKNGMTDSSKIFTPLIQLITEFYDINFKGLWDE
jgi:hypothetical protein